MYPVQHLQLILFLLLCCTASCGKIELEDPQPPTDKEDQGGDATETEPGQSDVLRVSQLATVEDGSLVYVGGYIVGYVSGRTLKQTVFSANAAVETNIVIADRVDCTDPSLCAAVQLTKGSEAREDLNLSDNPDNLGRYVIVDGTKAAYYYAPGIKSLLGYKWAEGPTSPDEGGDSSAEDPPMSYPTFIDGPPEVLVGC